MKQIVVDASCIGPFLLPDEAENLLPQVIDALESGSAIVPAHWPAEVGSLALSARKRGRIDGDVLAETMTDLGTFDIEIDASSPIQLWSSVMAVAQQHGLSFYDAAYLEIAIRRNLPLLTGDKALARAGDAAGIKVNPEQ